MTLVVINQGEKSAVVGTDLHQGNGPLFNQTFSQVEKLLRSSNGGHFFLLGGCFPSTLQDKLKDESLDSLLEGKVWQADLGPGNWLKVCVVDVMNNQVYIPTEEDCLKKMYSGQYTLLLPDSKNRRQIVNLFMEKYNAPYDYNVPYDVSEESADNIKDYILEASALDPQLLKGVAVYIVENGAVRKHYCSLDDRVEAQDLPSPAGR
ncbi:MAG: hypothetical protein KJ709_04960 [Nanoarchaeota archaeon]|nr:hypothetical protein [Nanoarchaeota archaeon]